MEPAITLTHIKRVTGISRNHLAEILAYSPNVVAKWEEDPARIPEHVRPLVGELLADFIEATDLLDETGTSWDEVMPARIGAMKLGVSMATFQELMRRRRRDFWSFGTMGLWCEPEDIEACRWSEGTVGPRP